MQSPKEATILIAEDEPAIRELYRREISKRYSRVLAAASRNQALDMYSQETESGGRIPVVITDIEMEEEMAGIDLIYKISRQEPATQFIIISNLHQRSFVSIQTINANVGSLPKPADMFHLRLSVSAALQRFREQVWQNRLKKLVQEAPWLTSGRECSSPADE